MYTADSPILGLGRASAVEIQSWFVSRGPNYAQGYAPDGQYQPPPPELGLAVVAECQRYASVGIVVNQDLCAGQILDETAAWQSTYARERNNPGGIGAINSAPDQALTFATPAEGIRAHVAHLLTYVRGDGPWTSSDPRAAAIAASGWLGVVRVLSDLNGRWAYPGTTYGQRIADLANALLATTGGTPVGTTPKPPMDTTHPSPNRDGFKAARRVEAIVWHISQGTLASNLSWLTNPNSGASANYEIARDGTIYELVPPEHSAWANGPMQQPDLSNPVIAGWHAAGVNANTRTISIEHEGYSSDNAGGSLTQAQIDSHIWLTAWLCEAFGLPPDRTHIIGHYQIDRVDRPYCPGFSDQEWRDWVAAVASYGQSPAPASAPPADDGLYLTGPDGKPWPYAYRRGFKGYVQQIGGARYPQDVNAGILSVFGYPKGEETPPQSDGKVYQEAERTILQYSPNTAPPWDIVMLPREARMP